MGEAPREIDFPYYDLRDGFQSTLMLVSDSPKSIDLTIAVKSLAGEMLTTAQTIGPDEKLTLDMQALVTKLGANPAGAFGEGSVSVFFTGTVMPVVGQISIRNPQLSLATESVMVQNDPGRSDIPAVLNGLWWGLGGGRTARVMVSNTSGQAQTADVFLDFQGQRHTGQPLFFAPYETKALDLTQFLTALGADPATATEGGITIIQRGPNPALIANGRIVDPATGFSTTIDFPSTANEFASALHADGLPVGDPSNDSPFAGAGSFVPHVIVRNLLNQPQSVTLSVEYPQAPAVAPASLRSAQGRLSPAASNSGSPGGGQAANQSGTAGNAKIVIPPPPVPGDSAHHPEWGKGTGATTATFTVSPTVVPGYGVEDISLATVLPSLPLPLPFVSVRIQYSGAPGSMEAEVSSVEEKGSLVVDARTENEGNTWAGSGANPWHLDNNTEAVLFLANMDDKPAPIGFAVTANGVHYYLTELTLQPHETRMIDLRKLRDAQIADFKGNKIPAGATDGSIDWIRLTNVKVSGRLMTINRAAGMTSSYDCVDCCCASQVSAMSIIPDIFDAALGSEGLTGIASFADCDNNLTYFDETDASTWISNNTGVCYVGAPGLIDLLAPGTCTISATFQDTSFTWDGGECVHGFPIKEIGNSIGTVGPTLSCGTVTRGQNGGCTISNSGTGTISGWKFTDAHNNTVTTGSTSAQWSGTAVTSGTVTVTVTVGGKQYPLSKALTVNARGGWAFAAASPIKVGNGQGTGNCTGKLALLISPPSVSGQKVGQSCLEQTWTTSVPATVNGGPNSGYQYLTSATNSALYQWDRVPDLDNTGSTFYVKQTGAYNAKTDPSGCISGYNLAFNTQRHEIGTVQGHWGEYKTAQDNPSNNIGTLAESQVGSPGKNFQNQVNAALAAAGTNIQNAFNVEPYEPQFNVLGVYLGNVNYAPGYTSCK